MRAGSGSTWQGRQPGAVAPASVSMGPPGGADRGGSSAAPLSGLLFPGGRPHSGSGSQGPRTHRVKGRMVHEFGNIAGSVNGREPRFRSHFRSRRYACRVLVVVCPAQLTAAKSLSATLFACHRTVRITRTLSSSASTLRCPLSTYARRYTQTVTNLISPSSIRISHTLLTLVPSSFPVSSTDIVTHRGSRSSPSLFLPSFASHALATRGRTYLPA